MQGALHRNCRVFFYVCVQVIWLHGKTPPSSSCSPTGLLTVRPTQKVQGSKAVSFLPGALMGRLWGRKEGRVSLGLKEVFQLSSSPRLP